MMLTMRMIRRKISELECLLARITRSTTSGKLRFNVYVSYVSSTSSPSK